MLRSNAAKLAFACISFRPTRPLVSRPLPPLPGPPPRVGPVIRPTQFNASNQVRSFGTSRRLSRLKDQGPFGDGFMDIGCKTIKVLLALVLVNTIVIPMWEIETGDAAKEAKKTEDEAAKVTMSN
ncbi:hypothetical protein AC578_6149 [Pseudocercospora eumusae]|uniref:Uncharacterized protein n=1 Tax=Pseudocercospora eumusae TaxID=321146 RepID=A0A139H996_9PEZI|nr:hypothetical protein AC578_6149 [Pseudocercospora eumusae]